MTRSRIAVFTALFCLLARVPSSAQTSQSTPEQDAAHQSAYFDGAQGKAAAPQLSEVAPVSVPAAASAPDSAGSNERARGLGVIRMKSIDAGPKAAPPKPGQPPVPGKPKTPPLVEIPDSDWREVGTIGDSVGDQNPSGRAKQDFWDQFKSSTWWYNTFDQLCKDVELPLTYSQDVGGFMKVSPEYHRMLHPGMDKDTMLVVDQLKLDISLSHGLPLTNTQPLPLSLGAGVDVNGQSFVIRKAPDKRACHDLLTLVNFTKLKLAWPLTAKRFKEMEDGEMWQLPLVLTASINVGSGMPLDPVGATSLGVSFGYSRSGDANVTIRRMKYKDKPDGPERDVLRVRLRFDYARVIGPSWGINATLPAAKFADFKTGSDAFFANILGALDKPFHGPTVSGAVSGAVVHQVQSWLNDYFTGNVNWLAQWVNEDHALIEFILDPNDESQMKGLEELLAGGKFKVLDTLTKRLSVAGESFWHAHDLNALVVNWREKYQEALTKIATGVKSFSGTDKAEHQPNSFTLKLPIIWAHSHSDDDRHDRVTILDENHGTFEAYEAKKDSSNGLFHLPIFGDYKKHNESRSAMAFSYSEKDGLVVAPTLVFLQQDGFINKDEESARELTMTADGMMRLVGVRGRGEDARAGLPLNTVFPEQDSNYRRGLGAFTMVISGQGVEQIINARPDDIIRSYLRTLDKGEKERKVLAWSIANAEITKEGRLRMPDLTRAPDWPYKSFKSPSFKDLNDWDGFEAGVRIKFNFAIRLANRMHEIAEMRPVGDTDPARAKQQAEAFKSLIAGELGDGVTYEDMMRVLVQLCDKRTVTSELVVHAEPKRSGAKTISGRYLFNRDLNGDPTYAKLFEIFQKIKNVPSLVSD